MMLRMSVLTEASFALSFEDANFGMAIAAKRPITTTTVSSSIKVKPFRLNMLHLPSIGLGQIVIGPEFPQSARPVLRCRPGANLLSLFQTITYDICLA